jgi:hypothetical protein
MGSAVPPPSPPAPAVRVVARALSTVVVGLLARTALAGGLGVGARRGLSEGKVAGVVSEQADGQSPRPSAGGQFRLSAGALRGCGMLA